jgi:inorganic pyrophosphatase
MKFDAVIEIPKGCDRRIHFSKEKDGFVDFGPIKERIPVNDGAMPIAYGFIKGTLNKSDRDEVDALVLSNKSLGTGEELEIFPIALILREDKDDKVVAVDDTIRGIKKWEDINEKLRNLIVDYFRHKHKILSIENSETAVNYLNNSTIK